MLDDIPNPFNQVVSRQPRPSHSGGRASSDGRAAGHRIVPTPATAEWLDGHELPLDTAPVTPITTAPGPGEVSSPSWWKNKPARHW